MGDVYANYNRLDRTFSKLESSELSEVNKQYLEDFTKDLMAQNLSDHKIYRYIQTFRVLSDEITFDLKDADRKDLVELVGKINQNQVQGKQYSPESKKELKKAIKKFYKWVYNCEDPDILGFMQLTIKKSNRKKLDASELPTKEEVERMIDCAKNPRDGAMLKLLWESGARAGELLSLDWSDLKQDSEFIRVDLDGKTGLRTVPVKEAIPLVEEWKNYQYDSYEPVFTSLQSSDRISYRCLYTQLRKLGDRAGLSCRVNPHAFRKSRATYLASEGANIFQLMQFFGWSQADTAKVYVRLAQSDVDDLVREVSTGN